jgi:antitoxin PrlF
MAIATLTTNGQVTIPKEIRDSLHLHTGDRIEIVVNDKGEAVIRPISLKVDDVFRRLHRPGQAAVPVTAMDEAIRARLKDNFK